MQSLRAERELNRFNIQILAASTDPAEKNKRFAEAQRVAFPILTDVDGRVAAQFGVLAEGGYARRVTFVIDQDGLIRHVMDPVAPGTHGRDLARTLHDLGIEMRK